MKKKNKKRSKQKPAKGVEGCLIINHFWKKQGDPVLWFRVYHPTNKRKFKDYVLRHDDLFVKITDRSAVFRGGTLDYSDKVLGYKS
jgi:hypothetical protein